MPLIALLLALSYGLPANEVGMLFLLSSSPVAAASYVMARAYCSDASDSVPLAASLIVVTTLLSMLTVTVGVFVLRSLHII
jgi:predicted permease